MTEGKAQTLAQVGQLADLAAVEAAIATAGGLQFGPNWKISFDPSGTNTDLWIQDLTSDGASLDGKYRFPLTQCEHYVVACKTDCACEEADVTA